MERGAGANQTALNILGAVATLSPLLAAATPPSPTAGELVPHGGRSAAPPSGSAPAGIMTTQYVILRAEVGELTVIVGAGRPGRPSAPAPPRSACCSTWRRPSRSTSGSSGCDDDQPITTRYKAVGVRSTWDTRPGANGGVEYVPLPVFDPSRGYTLDVPAGVAGGLPSARRHPARPGRAGEPRQPDLPRGRGRHGRRPRAS